MAGVDRSGILRRGRAGHGYLSVGRDITERKLAERRLAESERRLKLALEAGRQGVWELDCPERPHQGRPGAGGAAAPAERRSTISTSSARPRPTIQTTGRSCVGPSRPSSGATATPTGSRPGVGPATATGLGAQFRPRRRSGRGGQPVRMVGTTIDINQRKRAELHLRESEQRLRLALEAGSLGVWECDLATDGPLRCDLPRPAGLGRSRTTINRWRGYSS